MRILIDTDVLLDVALARRPFVTRSAAVLRWAENGGKACVAWHSIANCAYLLENDGREFLTRLMTLVDVATVGKSQVEVAMKLPMNDLEDALQVASALAWKADHVITRNLSDYRRSPVSALNPQQFLLMEEKE